MKNAKNTSSTTFKYNDVDDSKIYDALENKVKDKSQFIKNALYYYIIMIEKGNIIDRNLPQDEVKKNDNMSQIIEFINQQSKLAQQNKGIHDNTEDVNVNNLKEQEELDVPNELLDVDDSDFDF